VSIWDFLFKTWVLVGLHGVFEKNLLAALDLASIR